MKMIDFDRRVGNMAKRNFHALEVLDSPEDGGWLPPRLLEGDAVGGRVFNPHDNPSIVILGRLAFYTGSETEGSWRIIPYESIVNTEYEDEKKEGAARLDIILLNGQVERLYTSELSGILGVIHRKAQNYRWGK